MKRIVLLAALAAAAAAAAAQPRTDPADTQKPRREINVPDGTPRTPGGSANPPQQVIIAPPTGLAARQNPSGEIVLSWIPSPDAREYRVFVEPPPQPHMAGLPAIVGGGNRPGHFVVLPRDAKPGTVYRASIEAMGNNGTISSRAAFPPVTVQVAGSGSPAGGQTSTSGSGDRHCPPGQFVTGISANGALSCAPR